MLLASDYEAIKFFDFFQSCIIFPEDLKDLIIIMADHSC